MKTSEPPVQFRPHHFLCAVGYVGMGYSPEFTENFTRLTDRLRGENGDSVEIKVTPTTDSICDPCPHRRGDLCSTQDKISRLDSAHSKVLEWTPGTTVTWGEAKERIKARVSQKEFDRMCEGCGWKSSGVCEKALRALGALALGICLALPVSANSGPPAPGAAARATAPAPTLFADEVVAKLKSSGVKAERLKVAKAIAKASQSVEKGKFSSVGPLVAPVVSEPLFSDLGLFLRGQSAFLEARRIAKQNPGSAIVLYGKALEDLGRMREVRPETSLAKDAGLLMAEVEFGWAEALKAQKKIPSSRQILFRGLQRLASTGSLSLTPLAAVDVLIGVCGERPPSPKTAPARKEDSKRAKRKPSQDPVVAKAPTMVLSQDPFCLPWLQKLTSSLPKSSGELLRLTAAFGTAPGVDLPSRGYERRTVTYTAPVPDEAKYREAIDLILAEEWSSGVEKLAEFLKEFPRSTLAVAARYWLAQAEKRRGHEEEARRHLMSVIGASPLSYYGILASFETGTKTESFMSADVPTVVPDEVYLGPKERLHFERAKALIAVNEKTFSAQELKQIAPKANYASEFLIYLASLHHEVGNYLSVFQVVDELLQRSDPAIVSSYGLRLIFPTPYQERIQKAAKDNGIDPLLVLSLMKQESAFETKIASGSGAQGLMQLMPATAVETDPEIQLAKVVDPDENVRVGTKYLSQMIKRFDGNIAMALAAYNAGPTRVSKWAKSVKSEWGFREFIESIPFKETRGYVASIMRNYFWYTYRLKGQRLETLDMFWGRGLAEKPNGTEP